MEISQNTYFLSKNAGHPAVFTSVSPTTVVLPKEADALNQEDQIVAMYDAWRPGLRAYLLDLGLTRTEVDDVIQEAFVRLVLHLVEKKREDNIRGWLFRVARNLSMDRHRLGTREPLIFGEEAESAYEKELDPAFGPEEKFLKAERERKVEMAMQKLTHQQRESVLLRADGMHYEEIAEVLHITKQRAAFLVKRALARLAGFCG